MKTEGEQMTDPNAPCPICGKYAERPPANTPRSILADLDQEWNGTTRRQAIEQADRILTALAAAGVNVSVGDKRFGRGTSIFASSLIILVNLYFLIYALFWWLPTL
jgi:hypothetical protein